MSCHGSAVPGATWSRNGSPNRVEDRARFEEVLVSSAVRLAGYSVVESLYRDYGGNRWSVPRDWPDGERSPGVLSVL